MKKRIGIIGFGWIARDVHYPNYQTISQDCEITAVCDIAPQALENARVKTGLPEDCLFTDYKALIDSGLCDAVDICTPNYLHCEIAKYALNAGLPVCVEKPVGINSREVKEVELLAQEKNLPVFVCFSWRHRAAVQYLKDLVSADTIGELNHVYIKCIKDSALWPGRRLEWRFQKEKCGTGVLCDLGSHMLDLLNWLGTDVQGLFANYGTFVKRRQLVDSEEWGDVTTDDWANVTLDLKSGIAATVTLSRGCATCAQQVEVEMYGRNGYLKFDNANEEEIVVHLTGKDLEHRPVPESYGDPHTLKQAASFVNLLDGKTDAYTSTIADGLRTQLILDAAEIAGEEKRYVTIREVLESI